MREGVDVVFAPSPETVYRDGESVVTVDPGPLLASSGDRRQEALALLASDVSAVTKSGLKVVFNIHPVTRSKPTATRW